MAFYGMGKYGGGKYGGALPLLPPINLSSATTKTSIMFFWSPPVNSGRPRGYQVRINGSSPISITNTLTHTFANLVPNGRYVLEARSVRGTKVSKWATLVKHTKALGRSRPVNIEFTADWSSDIKKYETGLSHGVLYPQNGSGVAWPGLMSVADSHEGGDFEPLYLDGIKYLDLQSNSTYKTSITTFSMPDEFGPCNGEKILDNGIIITRQARERFGFSYRTEVGDGLGYQIHLVYNAIATPANRSYSTVNGSPSPSNSSWQIDAIPIDGPAPKPTAHYILDSIKVGEHPMAMVESLLYGTEERSPYLPDIHELVTLVSSWSPKIIQKNYETGFSILTTGMGDVAVSDTDGLYILIPSGRVYETSTVGLFALMEE